MLVVEGVNISSFMQKQIHGGGDRSEILKALKRLAGGKYSKSKRVSSADRAVLQNITHSRAAGAVLYALPYGDDGCNVYYYLTGQQEDDGFDPKIIGKFKKDADGANVWCIAVGLVEGNRLTDPGRGNSFKKKRIETMQEAKERMMGLQGD